MNTETTDQLIAARQKYRTELQRQAMWLINEAECIAREIVEMEKEKAQ